MFRMRSGFAMLEVLIIVAIVGLGMIPVISLLQQTAKQVAFNENMVVSNLWAVQLIERFRLTPFEELLDQFKNPVDAWDLIESDPLLKSLWFNKIMDDRSRAFFKQYQVSLQFHNDPDLTDVLGKLVCTVTWKDNQGAVREEERILVVENTDR